MENEFIYVEVKQEDVNGWGKNVYPCDDYYMAEKIYHAVIERFKENNKDHLDDFSYEDEGDAWYAYHNLSFNNFAVQIIWQEEMSPAQVIAQLESDGIL